MNFMHFLSSRWAVSLLMGSAMSFVIGCEGARTPSAERAEGTSEASSERRISRPALGRGSSGDGAAVPRGSTPELPESAFIRSVENRDPFEPMPVAMPAVPPPVEPDLHIVLGDRSLDEVRLVAIISGQGGAPRAMLVDPEGEGHTVQRGDLVGRSERVPRGPHSAPAEITWRIERIRPDRVIVTRHDPAHPESPVMRVLRLHPDGELARHAPRRKATPAG